MPIYLDNHATTPLDPEVLEHMMPYLTEHFGNPSSRSHRFGQEAKKAVETARSRIAELIGGIGSEIIFTSGATESDNLALKGSLKEGAHIITQRTEHSAILYTVAELEKRGHEVTLLDVGHDGRVDPADVRKALKPNTGLISIMLCNNVVGAIQPLVEIGEVARSCGALFHADAAQGVGWIPLDVDAMNLDLVSLSGHKTYGPKGVGALYVRRRERRVSLVSQLSGGSQERGIRGGTHNVAGIVGLGAAFEKMSRVGKEEATRVASLRSGLEAGLSEFGQVNGPNAALRHPGNLNMSFNGFQAEALLLAVAETVSLSAGSACSSGSGKPSYVLSAMGIDKARAASSLRFGLSRFTTESQIDQVIAAMTQACKNLRE